MKKELVCEYCNNEITIEDKKCPNCGANCSKVIKEYQKSIEQEEQDAVEKAAKKAKPKLILGNLFGIISSIIIIGLIVLAGVAIYKGIKSTGDFTKSKKTTVNYQEKATGGDLEATLLSYDLYEYKSDNFDNFNTKPGYQKIAFEFEVKNLSSHNNAAEITLKADGYNVTKTQLSVDSHFAKLVQGKEDYPDIDTFIINGNDLQKGYVGFEVPKGKKELLFRVGDSITIKMDNPVYNK